MPGCHRPTAGRKPLPRRRAQDLGIAFDDQALRFGDTLNQKDQAVHACRQCPNAIDKLIGAIFKPSHPGFKRTHPVDQIAFERDHPAIQTGNVVLQAVQSSCDGLESCGLTHSLSAFAPETPDAAQSAPVAIWALG